MWKNVLCISCCGFHSSEGKRNTSSACKTYPEHRKTNTMGNQGHRFRIANLGLSPPRRANYPMIRLTSTTAMITPNE